jgi:hypothetical protein
MESTIVALVFGIGMFFAGWFAHAWFGAGRRDGDGAPDEPPIEAYVNRTRWVCPQCGRKRQLPSDLDGKVMLCNNCQGVRLVRDEGR